MSIALHAATRTRRLWLLPPRDFSHHFLSESYPMDHDSISSGHTLALVRPGQATDNVMSDPIAGQIRHRLIENRGALIRDHESGEVEKRE
jgi:hypothetical protein